MDAAPDEAARLRAEITALRSELDRLGRRRRTGGTVRRAAAALLVMLAAFGLTTSLVTVWTTRTALDTDRWVATVGPLAEDPRITAALAEYTTDQVFDGLDVRRRLTEALPPRATVLVGPITGQLRGYVRTTVESVLSTDEFQAVWVAANRLAHRQAVDILLARGELVSVHGREVRIDLLPVVNEVLRQLEGQLPTLFGRRLNLPDLQSGEIPANLRATVEKAVGVRLPANFAQFTVYRGDELDELQTTVIAIRRGVLAQLAASLALLALALWVSPGRRRTLVQLGLWLVIWPVAVTASIRAVKAQILAQVPAGTYRTGVDAAVTTVFAGLRERGLIMLWSGAALAVVAYLCGPGRLPTALRRGVARAGRYTVTGLRRAGRWGAAVGPGWMRGHLDMLRVGGLVVAVAAALLLSSWTGLLVVAAVLLGYELLVTLLARA